MSYVHSSFLLPAHIGRWREVDMEAARLVTAVTSVKPLDTCKDIFTCGWKHAQKNLLLSQCRCHSWHKKRTQTQDTKAGKYIKSQSANTKKTSNKNCQQKKGKYQSSTTTEDKPENHRGRGRSSGNTRLGEQARETTNQQRVREHRFKGAVCKNLSLKQPSVQINMSFDIFSKTVMYCAAEVSTEVSVLTSEPSLSFFIITLQAPIWTLT